jgi:hypothetical protein
LNRAKRYRDQLERRLKPLAIRQMAESPSIRNGSGIVGVRASAVRVMTDQGTRIYRCWTAQWIDGLGRRRTRSFSTARYGEEAARAMAVAARRQGVHRARRTL